MPGADGLAEGIVGNAADPTVWGMVGGIVDWGAAIAILSGIVEVLSE